jgi:hypothetical protein
VASAGLGQWRHWSRRNPTEIDVTQKPIKQKPTDSEPKVAAIANKEQLSGGKPAQPAKSCKTNMTPRAGQARPKEGDQSKQDRVVAMLRRAEGATVVAVMKATGWQKHSVHGFFAGVVRKKLGLNLVSEVKGDERVYRVVERKAAKAVSSSRKRAA